MNILFHIIIAVVGIFAIAYIVHMLKAQKRSEDIVETHVNEEAAPKATPLPTPNIENNISVNIETKNIVYSK